MQRTDDNPPDGDSHRTRRRVKRRSAGLRHTGATRTCRPQRHTAERGNDKVDAPAEDTIEYPKWSDLPVIHAGNPDVRELAEHTWTVLDARRPRRVFRWGSELARVKRTALGTPILEPLTFDLLRHTLVRAANWYAKEDHLVLPPAKVIKDMLADSDPSLPLLRRIVSTPVFSADCRLICTDGYDESSGIFLLPPPGVTWLPVTAEPADDDAKEALRLIFDDLWANFPFVGPSDRAHALALLLLPFARALIGGPTPFHLFCKPTTRTGATLLVDTIHRVATGGPLNVMTLPEGEEERRRTLTAQLAAAPTYIIFDNLRELSSPAVSAAITSTRWVDRLIRSSNRLDLPVECGWVGTGNNPRLSDEIAGRTVPCRLDAGMERPWERDAFKHPFILEWVREHRVELVHGVLVLIQHWIAAGQPLGTRTLGGFESWSRVVGGILQVAQVPGFLGNLRELHAAADTDTRGWLQLFTKWWDTLGDRPVGTADVFPLLDLEGESPIDAGLERGRTGRELTAGGKRAAFGSRLVERQGRIFGGFRLVAVGKRHQACQWRLERMPEDQGGA